MKQLKELNLTDLDASLFQGNVKAFAAQFKNTPLLSGILHEDLDFTIGTQYKLDHKLGRVPTGWIVVGKDADANIYEVSKDKYSLYFMAKPNVIITDWVSFTPTGLWTTNVNYGGSWRRVGDTLEVRTTMFFSGAVGAGDCYLNLPPGLVIDTTKLWYGNGDDQILGEGTELRSGVSRTYIKVHYRDTTSAQLKFGTTAGGFAPLIDNTPVRNNAPTTIANGDEIVVSYSVPIVGWAAPTTTTVNLWVF